MNGIHCILGKSCQNNEPDILNENHTKVNGKIKTFDKHTSTPKIPIKKSIYEFSISSTLSNIVGYVSHQILQSKGL